jgi:hypothetical protein
VVLTVNVGGLGDAQAGGEIALEQQRGSRQRAGDVVEPEVAAVTRQQIGDVNRDAEHIAHRVRVLQPVQTMEDEAARGVLLHRGGVEADDERGAEFRELRLTGMRHALGRHRADAKLLHDALPGQRIRAGILEVGRVERERQSCRERIARVMAAEAVLGHHRLEIGHRKAGLKAGLYRL